MKNLGHFDPRAVELFEANFSENFEFSEDTDNYDFARCQRPDGSFYGTSGQCRKGKEAGAKEEVKSESRSSNKKEGNKGGDPQVQKRRADAVRRAAVVNALIAAKLPTNPIKYKREVNKRLAETGHSELKQRHVEELKEVNKAERKLRDIRRAAAKKVEKATPEERSAYVKAQQELSAAIRKAGRTANELARMRKKVESVLNKEIRSVTTKATKEAGDSK